MQQFREVTEEDFGFPEPVLEQGKIQNVTEEFNPSEEKIGDRSLS